MLILKEELSILVFYILKYKIMSTKFYTLILTALSFFCTTLSFADVTLTTSTIAASNVAQGSNNNIV